MTAAQREHRLSRDDMVTLLGVTRALAAPIDLPDMLKALSSAACRVLRAEKASVWQHDADRGELVVEASADLGALRMPVGLGLVGTCALTRTTINVPDCYADPRFDPSTDRRTGWRTRCSLTLPLVTHEGTLVGVMQVLNRRGGPFDATDEALGEALAAQCAVALERARQTAAVIEAERLRRELDVARMVQLASLPRALPEVAGYGLHALFLPAEQTGGDTYDLATTPHGLLTVIGDATGHGIAPAMSVMQMHAMLRMALRLGADLETAYRHVNDQLADTLPDHRFVTAFIGLLDTERHVMRFISGGQGPILHWRAAAGDCVAHRANCFPMGAMPLAEPRRALEVALAPGDMLALLTDGVFEAESPGGELFGRARVEGLVATHAPAGGAAVADALLSAVRVHEADAAQADDVTMVLVQRLASH